MRPRGAVNKWVKLNPWTYHERRQQARLAERREAIDEELRAEIEPLRLAMNEYRKRQLQVYGCGDPDCHSGCRNWKGPR